jgi:phytoene/squalene synthetase
MPKSSAVDLLAKALRQRELETQRAVWKTFGVDYEREKAKQQAIWNQLQQKREKGRSHLQRRYLLKFLKALKKVDAKQKREQTLSDLERFAELSHKHSEDERLGLPDMLKWARVEVCIYRAITYRHSASELKKAVEDELGES